MVGFTIITTAAFHNIGFAKCAGFMTMHHNCLQRSRAARTALGVGVGWVRMIIHQSYCIISNSLSAKYSSMSWGALNCFWPSYRLLRGLHCSIQRRFSDPIITCAVIARISSSSSVSLSSLSSSSSVIQSAFSVSNLKLFPEYLLQLTKVEEKTLKAFNAFFAETKQLPTITEVFERCKTSNKTSVSLRLMRLVEMGYLGAYQKGNKFIWYNRAEAERLQTIIERNSKWAAIVKRDTIYLNVFASILHVTALLGVRFNGDWSALGLTFYVANRER